MSNHPKAFNAWILLKCNEISKFLVKCTGVLLWQIIHQQNRISEHNIYGTIIGRYYEFRWIKVICADLCLTHIIN